MFPSHEETSSTTRRHHQLYRMRTAKLNVRRSVVLVVIVMVVLSIGSRISRGVDDEEEIEKRTSDGEGLTEDEYDDDEDDSNFGGTEDLFNGYSFEEEKSEREVHYEFDERKSELGKNRDVLKSNNSSEVNYYGSSHGNEDVDDKGSLGEWSVNSGAEEEDNESSFRKNTTRNDVGAATIADITANKTKGIRNGSVTNTSDESLLGSDGAGLFLDHVDVINEDGQIIKDAVQGERADGFRGVSIATTQHNDAIHPQYAPDAAQVGAAAQDNLVNELRHDNNNDGKGDIQSGRVIGGKNRSSSGFERGNHKRSKNDFDQPPLNVKSTLAVNKKKDVKQATRQPIIKRRVSGEEDIVGEKDVDDAQDKNQH